MSFWTFENFQKWKNKVLGQGVIQRKIADGSNRTAGKFFKTFVGISGLAKTASHNIFPEGGYIHET